MTLVVDLVKVQTDFVDKHILTPREAEVFACMVVGMNQVAIGKKLFISQKTVCTYRTRIHEKLGTTRDAELVKMAVVYNLLSDVYV